MATHKPHDRASLSSANPQGIRNTGDTDAGCAAGFPAAVIPPGDRYGTDSDERGRGADERIDLGEKETITIAQGWAIALHVKNPFTRGDHHEQRERKTAAEP